MNKLLFLLLCTGLSVVAQPVSPGDEGWTVLASVKFTEKFYKAYDEYYLTPLFDSKIRAREGKTLTLRGHYLPMELDDKRGIILSKVPYSACFFCGGAGPESVVEVYFPAKHPRFKADQVITVSGTLKLNDSDVSHMNFILNDAVLVP